MTTPVLGILWDSADCAQGYFLTRYSWFLSLTNTCLPVAAPGRVRINYEIIRESTSWNYKLGVNGYTSDALLLKNWVTINYATYGYGTAAEAFEDCFAHLKTGEPTATTTVGSHVITAYDAEDPTASRIPGPWTNPEVGASDWLMNIHATIYQDFWKLSKLVNYSANYEGCYFDNSSTGIPFVSTDVGLTYAKTKEYTSDTDSTYTTLYASILDAFRTIMGAQGKIIGGNTAYLVDGTYPYIDNMDFILREYYPWINTPTTSFESEIVVSRAALTSNPSFIQVYNHQTPALDDRSKIGVLAIYYLIQNANTVMLVGTPGQALAYWADVYDYDIGVATGNAYEFASGTDGWTGCDLQGVPWVVLGRQYGNNLVLWRGVPWTWWGTTCGNYHPDDTTMTVKTIPLGGTYRLLNADGTLGSPITTIDLENWEGAVLIGASGEGEGVVTFGAGGTLTFGSGGIITI